ncbi:hypothetical protein E2562_010038 [Oryza meyeriana var. granulata]|uniref:Uncharacterized protein n=1 Tax=Oryza meyeriana var. granulata TaxID=110450 RepID=A0A6G1EHR1_9ORYZ|nr:hypothetical protein E2562_010038 [Oryza meyeriana var. granulata]
MALQGLASLSLLANQTLYMWKDYLRTVRGESSCCSGDCKTTHALCHGSATPGPRWRWMDASDCRRRILEACHRLPKLLRPFAPPAERDR